MGDGWGGVGVEGEEDDGSLGHERLREVIEKKAGLAVG